jgi:hypothetical protein
MEKTDRFTTINSEISIVLSTWLTNRGNLIIQRVLIPYCDTPEQKDTPKWHSISQKKQSQEAIPRKKLEKSSRSGLLRVATPAGQRRK